MVVLMRVLPLEALLGTGTAHLLTEMPEDDLLVKEREVDVLVLPQDVQAFLRAAAGFGLQTRRLPSEQRFHIILGSWTPSNMVVLDAQIGVRYATGPWFHYSLRQERIVDLFECSPNGGVSGIKPAGRAVLYAANCVWLKRERCSWTHIEKLHRLCRAGLSDDESGVGDVLRAILRVGPDQGPAEFRHQILSELSQLFHLRLNPINHTLPRRAFSIGKEHATVVFLGPDGAGRTTLIEAVRSSAPVKCVVGYFGVGRAGWRLSAARALCERHGTISRVLFWNLLLPVELLLRRLVLCRRGRGRLHLLDRVPGRPLLRGRWQRWLYSLILPRPDIVVLVTGDADTIAGRKPDETTPHRTRLEIDKWAAVASALRPRRVVEVNTTQNGIDMCRDEVLEAIRSDQRILAGLFRRHGVRR